jgi:type II secretory pathway pseudopilin PulG
MKKKKIAFTLLEIMVVVALLWIATLWITQLNFNSLSNKQRLDWFFYKIKTNIETVKNNVLIWREIKDWTETITSSRWQIDFNNSGSWIIKTYYYNTSGTKKSYSLWKYDIIPEKGYAIVVSNSWSSITDTGSILINWGNLTLTWITTTNKVLEIKTKYQWLEKVFTINTVSWVIEEQ